MLLYVKWHKGVSKQPEGGGKNTLSWGSEERKHKLNEKEKSL